MSKALVVLSGGQDSTTCLGIAVREYGCENTYAIGFRYGQRHRIEMDCAKTICEELDISFKIIDVSFIRELATSALTNFSADINANHPHDKALPASFVPARNALFLTIAHGYAQEIDANEIYTGVCQTDYSGYPDCREEFIDLLEETLNVGYNRLIKISTPLMYLNKADTFKLAEQLGILEVIVRFTHTCYEGNRRDYHDWGYGCGQCPACKLRKKGWEDYLNLI